MNTFLPQDLIDMCEGEAGVKLAGTVHLQAGWEETEGLGEIGETKWLQEEVNAKTNGKIATGIVGTVDLMKNTPEQVRKELKAHSQYPGWMIFRGHPNVFCH